MNPFLLLGMFAATYYFAAAVQTILHRLFGHHDRVTKIYETHAKGHHRAYPPQRLLTAEWVESEQHVMWYYAIPFVPVALGVGWWAGWAMLGSHLAGLGFAIWWHLYLHRHYHLAGSRWARFRWFQRKRELHFIHHRDVHKNYAIVEYWTDRLLGTWKEPSASGCGRPCARGAACPHGAGRKLEPRRRVS